jgi:hypothetical protein
MWLNWKHNLGWRKQSFTYLKDAEIEDNRKQFNY